MIVSPKTITLAVVALLAPNVVRADDPGEDDGFGDDGFGGPLCYYDDQCVFACARADNGISDCFDYVPVLQGVRKLQATGIPFNVPYFRDGLDGECVPTKANPPAVGYCCATSACDKDEPDDTLGCVNYLSNPDNCEQLGMNYFSEIIVDTCVAVESGGGTDPHIKTFGGKWFDYMGECDLEFLHVEDFEQGNALDLHVRTRVRYEYSYIESAVLRIGEDVLEMSSFGEYFYNGVDGVRMEGGKLMAGLYPITHEVVSEKQSNFDIQIGRREKIRLSTFKDLVTIHLIDATPQHFGSAQGLMGTFDGKLVARNGSSFQATDDQALVNAYAQTWQVQADEDMLFQSLRAPLAGEQCRLPEVVQSEKQRRLGESRATREEAAKACAHLSGDKHDNCVYDVLAIGDLDIAKAGMY